MSVEDIKTAVVAAVDTQLQGKADAETVADLETKNAEQAATIGEQDAQIKTLQADVLEVKNLAADLEAKGQVITGAPQMTEMKLDTKAVSDALKGVLAKGEKFDLGDLDTKSLVIGDNAGGHELAIDQELGRAIIERARENVAILGLIATKNVGSTDYREMVLRQYPASAEGAEQTGNSNTAPGDIWALTGTQTYESVVLNVGKQYAKPIISDEAIADPHIDIFAHLKTLLSEEMSRYWALQVLFGNGAGNNLRGIIGARIDATESVKPASTRNFDMYPVVLSGVVDSIGNTDPTAASSAIDNAIDLTIEIPSMYLAGSKFVMNRRTLGKYRKLKDLDGRPLIQFEAGTFNLVGYAVSIEDYMPDVDGTNAGGLGATAARYPVIFGDLKRAYALCSIDDKFLVDPYSADGGVMLKVTSRKGDIVQHNDAIVLMRSDTDWV